LRTAERLRQADDLFLATKEAGELERQSRRGTSRPQWRCVHTRGRRGGAVLSGQCDLWGRAACHNDRACVAAQLFDQSARRRGRRLVHLVAEEALELLVLAKG